MQKRSLMGFELLILTRYAINPHLRIGAQPICHWLTGGTEPSRQHTCPSRNHTRTAITVPAIATSHRYGTGACLLT